MDCGGSEMGALDALMPVCAYFSAVDLRATAMRPRASGALRLVTRGTRSCVPCSPLSWPALEHDHRAHCVLGVAIFSDVAGKVTTCNCDGGQRHLWQGEADMRTLVGLRNAATRQLLGSSRRWQRWPIDQPCARSTSTKAPRHPRETFDSFYPLHHADEAGYVQRPLEPDSAW